MASVSAHQENHFQKKASKRTQNEVTIVRYKMVLVSDVLDLIERIYSPLNLANMKIQNSNLSGIPHQMRNPDWRIVLLPLFGTSKRRKKALEHSNGSTCRLYVLNVQVSGLFLWVRFNPLDLRKS